MEWTHFKVWPSQSASRTAETELTPWPTPPLRTARTRCAWSTPTRRSLVGLCRHTRPYEEVRIVLVQVSPLTSPLSPFKIKTLPAHDASKVRASGPGLNTLGVPASLPVEFTIDARDAGEGLLTVQILVSPRGPSRSGLGLYDVSIDLHQDGPTRLSQGNMKSDLVIFNLKWNVLALTMAC